MDTTDCIRHIVEQSGKSGIKISNAIGRSDYFISTTVSKGSDVGCSTMAAIADACGYELILKGHGEEIPIDPR